MHYTSSFLEVVLMEYWIGVQNSRRSVSRNFVVFFNFYCLVLFAVTTIAEKYASRGCAGPMNVLWTYHFINGNDAVAEKIWNEYVKDSPRIMFQRILQHARDANDEQLSQKLISHLKSSKVTEGALGNAYSCLLDILTAKAANERVVAEFEKAVKDVNINFINKTAVLRVQAAYEQLGRPFNYKVPTKADKQSSTSSSSSDVEKKA